jgi:flagellar biosynthesis anti-sigma factor FlgM
MNIDPTGMNPLTGSTPGAVSPAKSRAASKADAAPRQASDQSPAPAPGAAELSSRAGEFLKIRSKLAAVPVPSHEDRIAALQAQIERGDYAVDARRVADAMLQDEGVSHSLGLTRHPSGR